MVDTNAVMKETGYKTRKSVDDSMEKLVEYKYLKKKIHIEKGPKKVVVRGGRTRLFKFNPKLVKEMKESGVVK